MAVERLVYVGRDQSLGYIYVKLYQGLIKSAYIYLKRGRRMEYFAVLTARVAKTFAGEVRRRLMQFATDRVERAVKSLLREVEEGVAALAAKSDRVYHAFEKLYRKINSSITDAEDAALVEEFLEKARQYLDVEALWRRISLSYGLGLSLDKALQYAYWS